MAIAYDGTTANFSAVIYEDEVITLREYLQEKAGKQISFDFKSCEDIHLAVLQLIMAYKKNYTATYAFGDECKTFELVLKGFVVSENYCNK